jgi:hypothetical protein
MARTQLRSSTPPADPEREERIRVRAYLLWEADGRPHGRDIEHWERACELTGTAENAGGLQADPPTEPARPRQGAVRKTAAKAAAGKTPDHPANQDKTATNPPPKRAARPKPQKPAS